MAIKPKAETRQTRKGMEMAMTYQQALDVLDEIACGGRVAPAIRRQAEAIAAPRGERGRDKATAWRRERKARRADKRQFVDSRA